MAKLMSLAIAGLCFIGLFGCDKGGASSAQKDQVSTKVEDDLRIRSVAVCEAKREIAKIEDLIKAMKDKKLKEEMTSQRAKELLEKSSPGSKITIGSVSYAWEDVNEDFLKRGEDYKVLCGVITANEQMLVKLRKAYEEGTSSVEEVTSAIRKEKDELRRKESRQTLLQSQSQVQSRVDDIINKINSTKENLPEKK